jgi:addiction module RelE/StbE family toxin
MAKRTRIIWTPQSQEDLREIQAFIARDAPISAAAFVRRLKSSVDRLKTFPESGQVVPEINNSNIREILFGQFRIIYRVKHRQVDIITVFHGARLLDGSDF